MKTHDLESGKSPDAEVVRVPPGASGEESAAARAAREIIERRRAKPAKEEEAMPSGVYPRKPSKKRGAKGGAEPASKRRGRRAPAPEPAASAIQIVVGRALVSFASEGDATIIRIEPTR